MLYTTTIYFITQWWVENALLEQRIIIVIKQAKGLCFFSEAQKDSQVYNTMITSLQFIVYKYVQKLQ